MPEEPTYDVSRRAVKLLLEHFWTSQGWRTDAPSPEIPDAAIAAGLMFAEDRVLDHDGWVKAARTAVARVSRDEVSTAFIASLESRRLDLRSALGSFAVARWLQEHPHDPMPTSGQCRVCGLYSEVSAQDLNVLNFERFKWGGVRRNDLRYVVLDLELFARAPREQPSDGAIEIGRSLLGACAAADQTVTATQLSKSLNFLGGNAQDRIVVLEILAVCGVLTAPQHPGFEVAYVNAVDRQLAPGHWMDTAYPACWWRGEYGVDREAVSHFLPLLL
jgi:hypothetical protein